MAGCDCGANAESNAADAGYRRILWIALVLNAAMFAIEGTAGLIAGSAALQGDALDFMADAANYGIALFVLAKSLKWRAGAALIKGATFTVFGVVVLANTAARALSGTVPDAVVMGPVAVAALAVNIIVAVMLFRYRGGDANRRSVWLCSRNDAIANLGVIAAAGLVGATGSGWPDWLVGGLIAGLFLWGGVAILRQAIGEWRIAAQ